MSYFAQSDGKTAILARNACWSVNMYTSMMSSHTSRCQTKRQNCLLVIRFIRSGSLLGGQNLQAGQLSSCRTQPMVPTWPARPGTQLLRICCCDLQQVTTMKTTARPDCAVTLDKTAASCISLSTTWHTTPGCVLPRCRVAAKEMGGGGMLRWGTAVHVLMPATPIPFKSVWRRQSATIKAHCHKLVAAASTTGVKKLQLAAMPDSAVRQLLWYKRRDISRCIKM